MSPVMNTNTPSRAASTRGVITYAFGGHNGPVRASVIRATRPRVLGLDALPVCQAQMSDDAFLEVTSRSGPRFRPVKAARQPNPY